MSTPRTLALVLVASCPVLLAQNLAIGNLTYGSGYVSVPDSPSLTPSTGFTFEAWVYLDNAQTGDKCIGHKDPETQAAAYELLLLQSGRPQVFVKTASGYLGGPAPGFAGQNEVPAFVWTHLAMTYDNVSLKIFINANQVASFAAPGPVLTQGGPLSIGSGYAGGAHWHGRLDEVRLWSTALSSSQILSRKDRQIGYEPGLVSIWRFNGTYADGIGSNDGSPVGSVPFTSGAPTLQRILNAPASSPIGVPIVYSMTTPAGQTPYVFDVSIAGTEPGIVFNGFPIPLNPPFLNMSFGGPYFQGFIGTTNLLGLAAPSVTVPSLPSIEGLPLSACFVTTNPTGTAITTVGTPVTTVITHPGPIVSTVSPATGPHTGGTAVTIGGSNFLPGATVSFGGSLATGVSVTDASTIVCTSPPGSLGPVTVTVQNPDGLSASAPSAFTYQLGLELFLVYPDLPVPGPIIVYGVNFQAGLALDVGGVAVVPTSVTPSQVTFVCPAGVPCSATLTISNPGGESGALAFNRAPEIQTESPATGPAAGGTFVQLVGDAFYPGTSVTVGGSSASIMSLSLGSLLFMTPAGSQGPAPVVVTSPTGCTATTTFLYE